MNRAQGKKGKLGEVANVTLKRVRNRVYYLVALISGSDLLPVRFQYHTMQPVVRDASPVLQSRENPICVGVDVVFSDNLISHFDARWLWCNAPHHRQPNTDSITPPLTGQRLPSALTPAPLLISAAACLSGSLLIMWENGQTSLYPAAWLREHDYSDEALAASAHAATPAAPPLPLPNLETKKIGRDAVATFLFADVLISDSVLWALLAALDAGGLVLVTGAPLAAGTVESFVSARFGPPMPTLWGNSPDVPNNAPAVNGLNALDLHVDLCAYEAPPGVQMLHCRRFDSAIVGGESTFINGVAAAEALRSLNKEAFTALAKTPATFQRIAYARSSGAALPSHYVFRRPHIDVDASLAGGNVGNGIVRGVFWAPMTEGPLRVPHASVAPYYAARDIFGALLGDLHAGRGEGANSLIEFRLQEGDIAIFNNRRMMHGRRAFWAEPKKNVADDGSAYVRTLQGCYIGTDEIISRMQSLRNIFGGTNAALPPLKRFGNAQLW